jgi:hypothetical protein
MKRIQHRCASRIVATAITTALIGVQAPGVFAQNGGNSNIVLNRGTIIPVKLNTELTSNGAQPGDTFTATVDNTKNAYRQILDGATVDGVVRGATAKNGSSPGTLDVAFTRIRLASGSSYQISGSPTSLDPKFVTTRSDGILQAKNTNKDERLTYAGIGAGAGLLISVLTNGNVKVKDSLLDTALGGVLGYVAGSVLKGPKQVHDVDLKPGTEMGVLLNSDVTYSNYPQRGSYQPNGYHRSFVSNGVRYYWKNGQEWAQNLSTGRRYRVSGTGTYAAYPSSTYKYYTYQGHRYVLNRRTGQRTLLR